jgi:hypothetical protein
MGRRGRRVGLPGRGLTPTVAAPTFVSASSAANSASGTSLAITAPASIASGNLLVAVLSFIDYVSPTNNPWTATGWTLLGQSAHTDNDGNIAVFYKTAGGSEPGSYTFTVPNADYLAGGIIQYSGAATPLTVGFFDQSTFSTTNPGGGALAGGSVLIEAFCNHQGKSASSGPTGMTSRISAFQGVGSNCYAYDCTATPTNTTITWSGPTPSKAAYLNIPSPSSPSGFLMPGFF